MKLNFLIFFTLLTLFGFADTAKAWTCGSALVDSRDSKSYSTALIGTQCWMQQNLNVGNLITGVTTQTNNAVIEKYCYSNNQENCTTYGGFYQWDEAMGYSSSCNGTGSDQPACSLPVQGICPVGWHIPSHYEFIVLENTTCGINCAVTYPYNTTPGSYGNIAPSLLSQVLSFRALLSGYLWTDFEFYDVGYNTSFWTSLDNSSSAWVRQLVQGQNSIGRVILAKGIGSNIRCIRDILPSRTITSSSDVNGTISPAGATSVEDGASQTFIITPSANYHVLDVLVDSVSVGAVTSYDFINVTTAHTISATFAIDTKTITASAGSNGNISPTGATSVSYDANQTYTITPDAHFSIADVLVDDVSVGATTTYTFTNVTTTHTISASFATTTYLITATSSTGGTIFPSGDTAVDDGTDQTFTITPNSGYNIADVLVDDVSVGATTTYTFTNVTADHTISATFSVIPPTVVVPRVSSGSSGSRRRIVSTSQSPTIPTVSTPTSPAPSSNTQIKDLKKGYKGQEVKTLQMVLNILGFNIAKTGPGSQGNETDFFGSLTQTSLIKFQKAQNITPAVGDFNLETQTVVLKQLQKLLEELLKVN